MSPSFPPERSSSPGAIEPLAAHLPRPEVALLVDQQEWGFSVRGDRRLDTEWGRYRLNPDLPSMDWLNLAVPHARQPDELGHFVREAVSLFDRHGSLLRVALEQQPAYQVHRILNSHGLRRERCLTRMLLLRLDRLPLPPGLQVAAAPEERLHEFVEVSLRAFRGESYRWGRSADQLLEYAHRRTERGERFFLACLDGESVGAATLMPGLIPQITTLAVRFRARQRGVATALLTELSGLALEEGAWGVWLSAEKGSLAEDIYRRRGFEPLSERYEYVAG